MRKKGVFYLTFLIFFIIFISLRGISPSFLTTKQGGEIMAAGKKPMTKSQIVSHFAGKFDVPKKAAAMMLEEVAALAIAETKKAGVFTFPGIGKLVLSKRKARMGFNPATGEQIKIPAKTVVKMRIAKACKDAIVPPKK
jgi:DNA-binding protein HU-beta